MTLLALVSGAGIIAADRPDNAPDHPGTTTVDRPDLIPAEQMNGLVFDGLTAAQKALVEEILNENGCDCGCGMKIARCRRDDATCGRSLALGGRVIDLVRQGKGRDEIVAALRPSPAGLVEFVLPEGGAPSIGPPDARVTILHYTDYQ